MTGTITSLCSHCGGQLPANLFGGRVIFNCEFCQQLIHPVHCDCNECKPPHLADCECEACFLEIGLAGLRDMKEIRRKDEAERVRLGLSSEEKGSGATVHISNGQIRAGGNIGAIRINGLPQKACSKCNIMNRETANFCKNCGSKF
jgi:hypothetical protein